MKKYIALILACMMIFSISVSSAIVSYKEKDCIEKLLGVWTNKGTSYCTILVFSYNLDKESYTLQMTKFYSMRDGDYGGTTDNFVYNLSYDALNKIFYVSDENGVLYKLELDKDQLKLNDLGPFTIYQTFDKVF